MFTSPKPKSSFPSPTRPASYILDQLLTCSKSETPESPQILSSCTPSLGCHQTLLMSLNPAAVAFVRTSRISQDHLRAKLRCGSVPSLQLPQTSLPAGGIGRLPVACLMLRHLPLTSVLHAVRMTLQLFQRTNCKSLKIRFVSTAPGTFFSLTPGAPCWTNLRSFCPPSCPLPANDNNPLTF